MPEEPDEQPDHKPGRGGYLVAAALLLAGLAVFAAAVLPATRAVEASVEGMQRVVLEGEGSGATFFVKEPGRVLIHFEPISLVDGVEHRSEPTWEPELELRKLRGLSGVVGGSEAVAAPLEPTASTVVYRVGRFAGHSLVEVDLPEAGGYALVVRDLGMAGDVARGTIGPAQAEKRVLAIGNVPVERLKDGFLGVYGGAVVMGLLGCVAILVALITWARRHGTKTERVDGRPAAW